MKLVGLTRYRGDEIERLDVFSLAPRSETWSAQGIVALKDGTLFVCTCSRYALVRNDGDGRMEIFKTGSWEPGRHNIQPWWGGVVFSKCDASRHRLWHWNAATGETTIFEEREPVDVNACFSDSKRCCMITVDRAQVIEWDAEGRRQVFPIEKKEFNFTEDPEQVGTCLGRAIFLFCAREGEDKSKRHAYVGAGRLEKVGDNSDQWMVRDDRLYTLDDDDVLRCYEVRETPDSLLDMCVRRAASDKDSSSYDILPTELRELLGKNDK